VYWWNPLTIGIPDEDVEILEAELELDKSKELVEIEEIELTLEIDDWIFALEIDETELVVL
jgi:hypothetical protein